MDLDSSTPIFENTLNVQVGDRLTIGAIAVLPPAQRFNRVGLDLYYGKTGDAAVIPVDSVTQNSNASPARAGNLAGTTSAGVSRDLFTSTPQVQVSPGNPIEHGNLPAIRTFLNSIGGVSYQAQPNNQNFSNAANQELANWEFEFLEVGQVHFSVCGILDGMTGLPTTTESYFFSRNDTNFFHDECNREWVINVGAPIPEPASSLVLLGAVVLATLRRRRTV